MAMKRPSAAEDEEDTEKRNRMKRCFFKAQLRCHTLDLDIMQLWEKIKGTSRKAETAFINGVMSNGKVKADKTFPAYIEIEITVPRGIAQHQWGGAAELLQAIRDGDVKETEDNGYKIYSWR